MLLQIASLSLIAVLLLDCSHSFILPTKSSVRSSLTATIQSEASQEISRQKHICNICSEEFKSRNALFRHIRNSDCALASGGTIPLYTMKRNDVAFSIGYDAHIDKPPDVVTSVHNGCDAKQIGILIREKVDFALKDLFQEVVNDESYGPQGDELTPRVLSATQSSVAKLRHSSLSQENGVASVGDVMTLSYEYPERKSLENEKESFQRREKNLHLEKLVQKVQNYLDGIVMEEAPVTGKVSNIEILAAENLSIRSRLHAETDCTQKVYHYLLPLRWLKGGKETETWCIENLAEAMMEEKISFKDGRGLGRLAKAEVPPPKDTLRALKDHLRTAESKRSDNRLDENLAAGRYGVLGLKARRAFHNFADTSLKGNASPNNKPVWRVLDRCRIVQQLPYTDKDGDTHIMLVIAFYGDEFLPHQVRKIIGSAVAMTNGWLPSNFIKTATRPDVFLETPLAPANNMYLAGTKFHFHQLKEGKKLFEDAEPGEQNDIFDDFVACAHRKILERMFCPNRKAEESTWLDDLENSIAPRIKGQLSNLNSLPNGLSQDTNNMEYSTTLIKAPSDYTHTLALLRDIVSNGLWPSTSIARSKVIKKETQKGDDNDDEQVISSGSFTVINPSFDKGKILQNEKVRTPLGNTLFPDLVEAIFSLEESISNCRPPSSHCAINRNAQFTPHVDSGRGSGQSLSMIVGLGDYYGGELLVEGESNNIRYLPLEFDGWKERHWTAPFTGERYSLVWFTPEI